MACICDHLRTAVVTVSVIALRSQITVAFTAGFSHFSSASSKSNRSSFVGSCPFSSGNQRLCNALDRRYLRGLLIQWSVKVECWMEDSTFGMWQVVQFFVFTGQAAPG